MSLVRVSNLKYESVRIDFKAVVFITANPSKKETTDRSGSHVNFIQKQCTFRFLSYLGWLLWKLLFWNQCAQFLISGWTPYISIHELLTNPSLLPSFAVVVTREGYEFAECERSECQRRWRCSRLGSLKYRLTHRLLPVMWRKDCIRSLIGMAGSGRQGGVFTVPSALCSCKGAQKLRVASQQALSLSFQSAVSTSLRRLCCGYRTCTQIQNIVWQANHLQLLFSVGYTTQ